MKKTVLLLAILLAGLVVAFSFKSDSSPEVKIENISDDEIIFLENQALEIVYNTMITDGGPFEEPSEEEIRIKAKQGYHYCTSISYQDTRSDRLDWVLDQMGGWENPNHVHYINFSYDCPRGCPYVCGCWKAVVTTWTTNPC